MIFANGEYTLFSFFFVVHDVNLAPPSGSSDKLHQYATGHSSNIICLSDVHLGILASTAMIVSNKGNNDAAAVVTVMCHPIKF